MPSMENCQSLDAKSDTRSASCYTLDNEDASWITRFSVDEEFNHEKESEYAFNYNSNAMRSFSQLSVTTAEPIDYSYQEYMDDDQECDFKPQDCFSECSCGRQSSHPPKKHLAPGNPYTSSGDFSTCSSHTSLIETVIQQSKNLKEPPSYYHLLELNRDPIDLTLRLANVPSQYQVYEMHEFSAFTCSSHTNTSLIETVIQQSKNLKEPPSYYHLLELNRDPIDLTLRLANVPSQYQVYEMHEFSALYCTPGIEKLNGFDWTKKEKMKDSEYYIDF
uniref:Uncharacterized protein n=1 Tax=Panagrolaimus sp. JU765 TaxID=591449 RepID=A0AC34RM23_9BILA